MTSLVKLNGLVAADNGVFHASNDERQFDYSDGQKTEASLHKILSNATDLSSTSPELQAHIVDWPSEYHLSEVRANLLRALDLSGVKRVLELGCGCGSISRYLGEQTHLTIDAVEGSPSRAALAALRCRDLDNVTISTANFNQLDFPQGHYDLVLFVGVTEYAGRFSERDTDQQALQDLLILGKRAATPDGVVLVAIENRLGLKYMQGACEDHYAVPNIGLENYPNSSGIRTYSKAEWQVQIAEAGFKACDYIYPFPDYKVPTLLVNDRFIANRSSSQIEAVERELTLLKAGLARVQSRDYVADFDLGAREAYLWKGLLDAGTLAEHANSFLLLMSDSSDAVKQLSDFSIAEYVAPEYDYLTRDAASDNQKDNQGNGLQDNSNRAEARKQIESLRTHAANLQQTIDVMVDSQGWRWLNRLRRLLGRSSIK